MTTTALHSLIDQRRALAAKLHGVELEIAMHLGDRDSAQHHLREMHAQIEARIAAREVLAEGQA